MGTSDIPLFGGQDAIGGDDEGLADVERWLDTTNNLKAVFGAAIRRAIDEVLTVLAPGGSSFLN